MDKDLSMLTPLSWWWHKNPTNYT